jgi:hypothetical protein
MDINNKIEKARKNKKEEVNSRCRNSNNISFTINAENEDIKRA